MIIYIKWAKRKNMKIFHFISYDLTYKNKKTETLFLCAHFSFSVYNDLGTTKNDEFLNQK